MKTKTILIKETVARVTAEEKYIPIAEREIRRQRQFLEDHIEGDPEFRHSLEPYRAKDDAPEIVRRMAAAGSRVGVGPMAAVAGALAEYALKAMIRAGAAHAIVENGGDIALCLAKPAVVGIFTGPARIRDIGFLCRPDPAILGICTSSGTVGHSLSFGNADAAIVLSRDICLADATATALGNAAKDKRTPALEQALESVWIEGIEGMLVVMDDRVAMRGNLPELVKVRIEEQDLRPIQEQRTQAGAANVLSTQTKGRRLSSAGRSHDHEIH